MHILKSEFQLNMNLFGPLAGLGGPRILIVERRAAKTPVLADFPGLSYSI